MYSGGGDFHGIRRVKKKEKIYKFGMHNCDVNVISKEDRLRTPFSLPNSSGHLWGCSVLCQATLSFLGSCSFLG